MAESNASPYAPIEYVAYWTMFLFNLHLSTIPSALAKQRRHSVLLMKPTRAYSSHLSRRRSCDIPAPSLCDQLSLLSLDQSLDGKEIMNYLVAVA